MRAFAVLCTLGLLAALTIGSASAQPPERSGKHCYSGTAMFGQSVMTYSFSVVPSAPAVVLRPQIMVDGVSLALPKGMGFVCEASGSTLSFAFSYGPGRRFAWNYESEADCATATSDMSTIPGTYLGSDHLFDDIAQLDDDDLSGYEVLCDSSSCEPVTYNSGFLQFTGLSGNKSPCGLNGTTSCQIAIEFTTAGNCESIATPRAAVVGLQVIVRPGDVLLTSFRPSTLANPVLLCSGAALSMQSAGVALEFEAPETNSADCGALLSDLKKLATGRAVSLAVDLGEGEIWEAISTGPALSSRTSVPPPTTTTTTTGQPGKTGADGGDDMPAQSDMLPAGIYRPVQPHVYCNHHYGSGFCCAVYGYTNPNLVPVVSPAVRGSNFMVPYSVESQPTTFLANRTVDIAFSVVWDCRKYERHMKTWTVHTNGTRHGVEFRREAVASRYQDNCDFAGLDECGAITAGGSDALLNSTEATTTTTDPVDDASAHNNSAAPAA